jgi:hypothetical protein
MHKLRSKLGIRLGVTLILAALAGIFSSAQISQSPATRQPVVVELFTSEGCSSCPPADALLKTLQARQPVDGAVIIAIEEHVDYWNHDGWVDPYSSPEWTERQVSYGTAFKGDAYTPEAAVDGRRQFVGNDPQRAELEIKNAASQPKTDVQLTLAAPSHASSDVPEVWLAITEDGLHSSVSRGENAGRVLQHTATLRSLRKIGVANQNGSSVSFAASPVVKIDHHWAIDNLRVTIFVQQQKSREILGADSIRLKN